MILHNIILWPWRCLFVIPDVFLKRMSNSFNFSSLSFNLFCSSLRRERNEKLWCEKKRHSYRSSSNGNSVTTVKKFNGYVTFHCLSLCHSPGQSNLSHSSILFLRPIYFTVSKKTDPTFDPKKKKKKILPFKNIMRLPFNHSPTAPRPFWLLPHPTTPPGKRFQFVFDFFFKLN